MEAKDIKKMKLEELIGSLRTFEMHLEEDKAESKKMVAFQGELQQAKEEDDGDLVESMVLLSRNFTQMARKLNKRIKGTYPQNKDMNVFPDPYNASQSANNRNQDTRNKYKGIQCRECGGYGQIQAECANLRKKNSSYVATWSDEEYNEEEDNQDESVALVSLTTTEQYPRNCTTPGTGQPVDTPTNKPIASVTAIGTPDTQTTDEEIGDGEEISDEEVVHS